LFKAQIGGDLSRPVVKLHDTRSSLQRNTFDAAFDGELKTNEISAAPGFSRSLAYKKPFV
jgi:hypothetical protein